MRASTTEVGKRARRIFDISVPLTSGIPVWPGSVGFRMTRTLDLERGDPATVSRLDCDVHVGTHVDAPCHFIAGRAGADELPLDVLVGPALVVHLPDAREIGVAELESAAIAPETRRVLFRTSNAARWERSTFDPSFVALTPEGAAWLVRRGIKLVGVDYLSVQRFHDAEPLTHRTLLDAGVVVVEGLNLADVPVGRYRLTCLPLRLVGSDGAPARAILEQEESL